MTETIRLQVWRNAEDGAPVRYREGAVDITDDHIRAIVERAVALGLFERKEGGFTMGVPGGIEYHSSTTRLEIAEKPAAPADDEVPVDTATHHAMWKFIMDRCGLNLGLDVDRIINGIRRGEVPGLPSPDEHAALKAEVERLRAQITGIGATPYHDRMKQIATERDAAIARAEKAEGELERQVMTHQTDMGGHERR
jgi:hypothetical protein